MTIDRRRRCLALFPAARSAAVTSCLGLGVVLLLAGCVAWHQPGPNRAYSPDYVRLVFASGLDFISERHVEPAPPADMALNGLNGLRRIDPAISVRLRDNVLAVSLAGGDIWHHPAPESADSDAWADLVTRAVETLRHQSRAMRAASPERIFEAVYDRVLRDLDPYSRYANLVEAREARAMRDGFGGIGVSIRMDGHRAIVLKVVAGGPGARAGLRADDRLLAVDGEAVAGWSQKELVDTLRGPVGTAVRLTLRRAGLPEPLVTTVKRRRIVPQTVESRREGNIGIVTVSGFNQRTALSVRRALVGLRRTDTDKLADTDKPGDTDKLANTDKLGGVVLDLRDNPGGLLEQAVQTAAAFMRKGEIVSTRGRHPQSRQDYRASGPDYAAGLPLIVLINGDSASSAEIVAAALQDNGRAVVIGSNSHGKGTVQTVYRMPNDGELTVTWSRFYPPSGYRLHGRGVLPNLCSRDAGVMRDAAPRLAVLRKSQARIRGSMAAWRSVPADDRAGIRGLRRACPAAGDTPARDLQLARALFADAALYAWARDPWPSVAGRP